MREERKQGPKCPPQNELPPSEIVWQGRVHHLCDYCPCRIVLRYLWHLPGKTDGFGTSTASWEAKPGYVYERANENDAMGNSRYETQPKTDIPDQFFAEVLDAFRKAKGDE